MADVYPRRDLPGTADVWGRKVEEKQISLEVSTEINSQAIQAQNRNTASSLAVIGSQIQALTDAQALIQAQQAQIIANQEALTATTAFLSTQTVSQSRSTLDQYSGSNSGTTWLSFDGTYDCSVSVTTGSAGRLLIQASANLLSGGLTSILAIEIVGVTGPDWPGAYSTYVSTTGATTSGASRIITVGLSANTTYTVRTRRGMAGTSGAAMWRDQSLSVTRS